MEKIKTVATENYGFQWRDKSMSKTVFNIFGQTGLQDIDKINIFYLKASIEL